MKKYAYSKIELVVVLAGLAILAAVLMPMFERTRSRQQQIQGKTCQSNLKQMALGIKQYVQDYDERYPTLSSNQGGWMMNVQPYTKSLQIFQCPSDLGTNSRGSSDYFYNARLAAIREASLEYITNTIMNGDGESNAAANVHLAELPLNWLDTPDSPSFRHEEDGVAGAMYSYADGHVKFVPPAQVSTESPTVVNTEKPLEGMTLSTFAVR